MHEDNSCPAKSASALPQKPSWTDRARRMVEYHPDALDFIRRASEHFPTHAGHVQLLLRLWIEADALDALILPMLDEMNAELLHGSAEIDTTRGVSTQPSPLSGFDDGASDEVLYECFWSISCPDGRGVSVVLAVSDSGVFQAHARGSVSAHEHRVGYPVAKDALQDALVAIYVAETTAI